MDQEIPKTLAHDIYSDVVSPAAQEVGAVIGHAIKVLLSPIHDLLWNFEKIEQYVIKVVSNKLFTLAPEKLKTPDSEIAVPLLQSLTYTIQNETLRDLYLSLLANSMNLDKEKVVHPAYVEIIRKMNRLDAMVFKQLALLAKNQAAVNPRLSIDAKGHYYGNALPEWYLGWKLQEYDEYDVSVSIVRLSKFGLLDLFFDKTIQDGNYQALMDTEFLLSKLKEYQGEHPEKNLQLTYTRSAVSINEFGKAFWDACQV